MPSFRKKPVVIQAWRWNGEQHGELGEDVIAGRLRYTEEGMVLIDTLEGVMLARLGDWIIRGVKGELYPCKPDIFAATYDAVAEPVPEPIGTFRCPRRDEIGGLHEGDLPDVWRDNGTCSYCGSIKPESLLEQIAAGIELTPTDKSYKVYVGGAGAKFYFQHLDKEQCEKFIALHNNKTMKLGFPGHFYVPPFFMRKA